MSNSEMCRPVGPQTAAASLDRRRGAVAATGFTLSLLFTVVIISGLLG